MPLDMSREVFITCAVTGAGGTEGRSPHVPRSPKHIADAAVAAANAGAAIVHCHVRDPETGVPTHYTTQHREVTQRIRDSGTDVVLNLTCGFGGDLFLGPPDRPMPPLDSSVMYSAERRLEHLSACRPEIATLDCGSMNFAENDYVMVNTPGMLRALATGMRDLGIRPEVEAFDTGHLWLAKGLTEEGVLDDPALVQLCMGVPWAAPDDLNTFLAMVNAVPAGWTFSAFGLGRHQMPYVAAAVLAGGNVRVGLEDNLMLERGILATNAQLVSRAIEIVERLGATVVGPRAVRDRLGLTKQDPP